MTKENYLTAQDARKLYEEAHSLEGEYMREETTRILDDIRHAALKGKGAISSTRTDQIIVKRLRHLGYSVEVIDDQRDGNYLNVSW